MPDYGLSGAVGALGSGGFGGIAGGGGVGPYRGAGTPPLPVDPTGLSGQVNLASLGLGGGMLPEPIQSGCGA